MTAIAKAAMCVRVLHIHSGNLYGGVETFLLSLARFRTFAPSMEMSVALTSDGRIGRQLQDAGVPVSILGETRISRPLTVTRARRALHARLQAQRPDVIVCHQPWPLALFGSVGKRHAVPVVLWMHMAAGRHWLDRLAWRVGPDTVVCNSRFTASTLPASGARVEIVYAPIDVPAVRHRQATSDSRTVILQVSRMEPLKGHAVLLDALAKLRDDRRWTCRIAGGAQRAHEAEYMASLRARARALGIADRVEFLGERSDVPSLLAAADIYCQPNVEPDAFGLSLVEALAAGLPVVTSELGGAREIIDETCGVVVRPRDAAALASELSALLDDPVRCQRLGANGPPRARALCDPSVQMGRIAEILERAASRERSGAGPWDPASGAKK